MRIMSRSMPAVRFMTTLHLYPFVFIHTAICNSLRA